MYRLLLFSNVDILRKMLHVQRTSVSLFDVNYDSCYYLF